MVKEMLLQKNRIKFSPLMTLNVVHQPRHLMPTFSLFSLALSHTWPTLLAYTGGLACKCMPTRFCRPSQTGNCTDRDGTDLIWYWYWCWYWCNERIGSRFCRPSRTGHLNFIKDPQSFYLCLGAKYGLVGTINWTQQELLWTTSLSSQTGNVKWSSLKAHSIYNEV